MAALLLTVAGCETPASRLDPGTADFITPQVTTRAQVVQMFGEPAETIAGDGRTLLAWKVVYWASGDANAAPFSPAEDSNARFLTVLFDQNEVVIDHLYSNHSFHTFIGNGSASVGDNLGDSVVSRIKPNQTTKSEAVAVLGQPMAETLNLADDLVLDWSYSQGNYISGQTQLHTLRLLVDKTGTVVSVHIVNDQ